jgi:xanthine dehydrogenase YagR molybdenum-binding subunit
MRVLHRRVVVEAVAFHDRWRREMGTLAPSTAEIGAALAGHLCRCGAYANILRAVAEACAGRFDGEATTSPRLEARDKVTGAAHYTVDVRHDGQLEGCILRARVAALAAIAVTYTPLPAAIGPDAARAPGAAIAFGSRGMLANASEGPILPVRWRGNLRGPSAAFSFRARRARRWVRAARRATDPWLVEGTFHTAVQQHTALEPHAAVARFDGDRLTLHVSTQAVSHVHSQIAKRLALDAVARPRRSLKAVSLTAYADTGVSVNSTIAGLGRLIYPAKAKHLADFDVVSNLPPAAPFRGPGGPPMAFALEQAIDEAALRLKTDPIAPTPTGNACMRGPQDARYGATPCRPATGAFAGASASPRAIGCICGSPAQRSNLRFATVVSR